MIFGGRRQNRKKKRRKAVCEAKRSGEALLSQASREAKRLNYWRVSRAIASLCLSRLSSRALIFLELQNFLKIPVPEKSF